MNKRNFLIIFLVVLLTVSVAYPQKFSRGKGRLRGTVADKSGTPLVGALIILTHEDKVSKFKKKTNKKGEWGIIGLGTGEFMIDITLEGYMPFNTLVNVSQLSKNPPVHAVMKEVKKTVVQRELKPIVEKAEKLYAEKKYDEAQKIYNSVLEKAPKVYQIIFRVGDCMREKGEETAAIETYEKGIKLSMEKEDNSSTAKALGIIGGMYLKKKDLKKANEYFTKSAEINPNDEILAYNVAEINFNNMKTDDAIKYYQMAIKIKPTWAPPYKQIGYAYLNKGDMKKAIEMFYKFIEIDPNSKDAAIIKQVIQSLKQ